MKEFGRILTVGFLVLYIAGIALTANEGRPENATRVFLDAGDQAFSQQVTLAKAGGNSRALYNCALKVFMVERESRWKDSNGQRFGNGFMSYAFDTTLSLAYQETYQETKIYDIGWTGWVVNNPDSIFVNQDNMKAIAVLYNAEASGTGISDPYYDHPQGSPFTIHYVDACAGATHGNPGYDTAYGNSTHTVFIEEASTHT
jgi:hypothetical protein